MFMHQRSNTECSPTRPSALLTIRSSSVISTKTAQAVRRLGFYSASRLLELVVLRFDSGNELIIHAMKARRQYLELLD